MKEQITKKSLPGAFSPRNQFARSMCTFKVYLRNNHRSQVHVYTQNPRLLTTANLLLYVPSTCKK